MTLTDFRDLFMLHAKIHVLHHVDESAFIKFIVQIDETEPVLTSLMKGVDFSVLPILTNDQGRLFVAEGRVGELRSGGC